jgi:prephenate dehydrogenase
MTIQITIIGLGQVGASIGLALGKHKDKILRCGHDPEPTRAKKMQKEGAVDKVFYNLPESVREAEIVLLALPVDQIEDTFKYMVEDLKPGTVVIDTSPLHSSILSLAKKMLPSDRHFISMTPSINPLYLNENPEDFQTPHADLFDHSEMVITPEATTHPDAVKLAGDLTNLVGATAYFSDPFEADGISARIELMPKLVTAALIQSTIDQPGWKDARRFASKPFSKATTAIDLLSGEDSPSAEFLLNQENSLSAIDAIIENLLDLRDMIEDSNAKELDAALKHARQSHSKWLDQRNTGDWEKYIGEKPPSTKERLGGLFGIRPKKKTS